jgi:hypothetical protein
MCPLLHIVIAFSMQANSHIDYRIIGEKMMNTTLFNDQDMCQIFKKFLGIPKDKTDFFIGGWVSINDKAIVDAFTHRDWDSSASMHRDFINFIAQTINSSDHGAGLCYELYETRRQEAIKRVLGSLSQQMNDLELAHVKRSTGYEENFKDEAGKCRQCGDSITGLEYAHSFQHVGKELCQSCCYSEMI